MTISKDELEAAHTHSFRNKDEVIASEVCGCFDCLKIYPPSEIKQWHEEKSTDDRIAGFTAICPYCNMDTVLGSKSGYSIDHDFLIEMQKHCCPTEEQLASHDYEIIEADSFSELFNEWKKRNSKK